MRKNKRKSKEILTRLLVLHEHLDNLRALPKPRTEKVENVIEALFIRIEKEKRSLRNLPD
jgi:hypothetical protein